MNKMVEKTVVEEEEKQTINKKEVATDIFYGTVKGLGGLALKTVSDLKIEGKDKIPIIGKAILTTVSDNVFRDMLVISLTTGRKVHFMLHPKIMANPVAGPLLKSLGMIRGTKNKDDTEPIDKVFEILNQKGDLMGMTPEAKLDRETQLKSVAGIIKFAVAGRAPIVPLGIYTEKSKLFDLIPVPALRVKIGDPIEVDKKLNRDKYRDQRYELAEGILKMIESLKKKPEEF
ncbi:MAG: hypothetical protein GF383_09930 [Candidatus Lokiarchaeota archaeon]|nr:hypothetical protein [Candidatus Lokiarchaeota archaeon]MBD3340853.1 hypothetical protein [Candidatus Lokiarchaeota archaeon]